MYIFVQSYTLQVNLNNLHLHIDDKERHNILYNIYYNIGHFSYPPHVHDKTVCAVETAVMFLNQYTVLHDVFVSYCYI